LRHTSKSDQIEDNLFVADFGNGSARAYDQRMGSLNSKPVAK